MSEMPDRIGIEDMRTITEVLEDIYPGANVSAMIVERINPDDSGGSEEGGDNG